MDALSISRNSLLLSFFRHVLNGFTYTCPAPNAWAKFTEKSYYSLLLLLHAHISKPLNNSNANISLQFENIMAADTLNGEMYFLLCRGNNCLHCFIRIEYLKYCHKNSNPLIGILSHNGNTGHRTSSFPCY